MISSKIRWSELEDFIDKQPIEDQNDPNISYDIRTTIFTNSEGKKVQRKDFIKIVTNTVSVPTEVYQRQQRLMNHKFGLAARAPQGENFSMHAEDISINKIIKDPGKEIGEKKEDKDLFRVNKEPNITCRNCGGPHWTSSCTNSKKEIPSGSVTGSVIGVTDGSGQTETETPKKGKYVPPSQKNSGNSNGSSMGHNHRDDHEYKIRLNNLSEETNEDELYDLMDNLNLGSVARINVIRDRISKVSRGFAFIIFHRKESVDPAIKKLSGHRFNHTVLQVERAKART